MQKYLGKLFHVVKCTTSGRAFMSRLLDVLRTASAQQIVEIPPTTKWDAYCFYQFLSAFNGLTLIKPDTAQEVAYVDSCLTGAGGLCEKRGYYC